MKTWKTILCLLAGAMIAAVAGAEERYQLIAHTSVPLTSISSKDVALLFLKKVTTYQKWGSAQNVVPFDLAHDSDTREAFTKAVHGKAVTAIKAYWQQQIFSGRGTPPSELASDADVIASVARTAGGIGYVSADAKIPGGVKFIRVTQ